MRAILVAMSLLFGVAHASGPAFTYEAIEQTNASQSDIYDRAVVWVAETFKSSKEILQFQDKQIGKIIGNGTVSLKVGSGFMAANVPCTFKMKIDIKDKKYRVTFSDVMLTFNTGPLPIEETNRAPNEAAVREVFDNMIAGLKSAVEQPAQSW